LRHVALRRVALRRVALRCVACQYAHQQTQTKIEFHKKSTKFYLKIAQKAKNHQFLLFYFLSNND
jgi:hypothetical protein